MVTARNSALMLERLSAGRATAVAIGRQKNPGRGHRRKVIRCRWPAVSLFSWRSVRSSGPTLAPLRSTAYQKRPLRLDVGGIQHPAASLAITACMSAHTCVRVSSVYLRSR